MQANKFHYLYIITNSINSKIYVGIHSTENLKDGYLGSGKELNEDKKKYGKNFFNLQIIKYFGSRKEALSAEKEIVSNDFRQSPLTYNIKRGGLGGWYRPKGYTHSIETRLKMSESALGDKNPFYGKTHTEETKAKISRLGTKRSDSAKRSISKSKMGKLNPMHGTIAPNAVYVVIDKIKYTSIREASVKTGISPSTISRRCADDKYPNFVKGK